MKPTEIGTLDIHYAAMVENITNMVAKGNMLEDNVANDNGALDLSDAELTDPNLDAILHATFQSGENDVAEGEHALRYSEYVSRKKHTLFPYDILLYARE